MDTTVTKRKCCTKDGEDIHPCGEDICACNPKGGKTPTTPEDVVLVREVLSDHL
jgi:hypothetical protein